MEAPEAIVGQLAPDEAVRGRLRTAGLRASVTPDGSEVAARIWAIATDRRLWLVATGADGPWGVAVGDPSALAVVSGGWSRSVLKVGRWQIPLTRGTVPEARALIAHVAAGGGGDPWPPSDPPGPTARADAARGAPNLPPWLSRDVPADPEERWLHARETGSTQPIDTYDGKIHRAPLWIASTDRRTVLAAPGSKGGAGWWRAVDAVSRAPQRGRDLLTVDDRAVRGPRGSSADIVRIATAPPGPLRWTAAIGAALDGGAVRDALRLIAEAHASERPAGWGALVRVLVALQRPILATAAAGRALSTGDPIVLAAVPPAVLAAEGIDLAWVRGILRSSFDALAPPDPPEGLPWPPLGAAEVWIAALIVAGRVDEARPRIVDLPPGSRRTRSLAAVERNGDAWDAAAHALRPEDPGAATRLLDRALSADPTPARLWLRGAWGHEDTPDDAEALDSEVERHWSAAIALDPQMATAGTMSASALQAIAEVAMGDEAWEAAIGVLSRGIAAGATDAAPIRAEILANRLHRPGEAADQLDAWLATAPAPAAVEPWLRLAELRLAAGDPEAAGAALRTAVATHFLEPVAWARASALADAAGVDPRWWAHVHGVLSGGDPPPGRPPVTALTAEALDALHPGGVGRMEWLRQRLTSVDPPDRRQLVRGLAEATDPEVLGILARHSVALGTTPPSAFVFRGAGAFGCSAWATDPPVLLIGADHLPGGDRALPSAGLAFLLSVELAHLALEHPVLAFDADLMGTSRSMYQAFGRFSGPAEGLVDLLSLLPGVDQLGKLQTMILLSRRVFATRSAIDRVSDAASPFRRWLGISDGGPTGGIGRERLEGAALSFRMQADRAALLLTGDLGAAVEAILQSSATGATVAGHVRQRGLSTILEDVDEAAPEALRLAALVAFAASL